MNTNLDIAALRADLDNESQEAFGARFGVSQSAVSLWETKGPPSRGLVRLELDKLRAATKRKQVAA